MLTQTWHLTGAFALNCTLEQHLVKLWVRDSIGVMVRFIRDRNFEILGEGWTRSFDWDLGGKIPSVITPYLPSQSSQLNKAKFSVSFNICFVITHLHFIHTVWVLQEISILIRYPRYLDTLVRQTYTHNDACKFIIQLGTYVVKSGYQSRLAHAYLN